MENTIICQSCTMPLMNDADHGTNKDGSRNKDYCIHCYSEGAFVKEVTMNQMIETCLPFMMAKNQNMSEEEARKKMQHFFPTLKRWKEK